MKTVVLKSKLTQSCHFVVVAAIHDIAQFLCLIYEEKKKTLNCCQQCQVLQEHQHLLVLHPLLIKSYQKTLFRCSNVELFETPTIMHTYQMLFKTAS